MSILKLSPLFGKQVCSMSKQMIKQLASAEIWMPMHTRTHVLASPTEFINRSQEKFWYTEVLPSIIAWWWSTEAGCSLSMNIINKVGSNTIGCLQSFHDPQRDSRVLCCPVPVTQKVLNHLNPNLWWIRVEMPKICEESPWSTKHLQQFCDRITTIHN